MSVREQRPATIRHVEDEDGLERSFARGQQVGLAEKSAHGLATRGAEAPDDEIVVGDPAPGDQAGDRGDQPRSEEQARRPGSGRESRRTIPAQGEGSRDAGGAGDQDRDASLHAQGRQQKEEQDQPDCQRGKVAIEPETAPRQLNR